MTFDIGLHEVCVRVGVRYVITKFSRMDSLPNFVIIIIIIIIIIVISTPQKSVQAGPACRVLLALPKVDQIM